MSKLITPKFRGSFVTVMEPKAFSADQAAKYSVVIALPKENDFWKKLDDAIESAAVTKWGEKPAKMKTFIKDGDDEDEKYGWQGCWVITASNKSRPGVVVRQEDGSMVEPVSNDEIYSGAYYAAAIRPYAYEFNKSKGVAISLDNLCKISEGEKFTSRTSAEDDFKDVINSDWE